MRKSFCILHFAILNLQFRLFLFAMLPVCLLLAGCGKPARPKPTSQAASSLSSSQIVSDVLATLADLEATVNLEMRPMRPILDSKLSENRDLVQATLKPPDSLPNSPSVALRLVSNNAKLKKLEVQPDDVVRVFFETDTEDGKKTEHKDLEVAKVENDTDLLLKQGPLEPVETPVTIEIWRRTKNKLAGLQQRLSGWVMTGQPAVDWEPTPDEELLHEVVARLNQSLADQKTPKDWQPDALLATLPDELRNLPPLKTLGEMKFTPDDGRLLEEAVWLRDISYLAADGQTDELSRATALFDWTVRHIQLETRKSLQGQWRRPWQSLMFGNGTAEDRAWVFILLARQQGLDAVMLASRTLGPPAPKAGVDDGVDVKLRPFLPAVLIQKQLYLFDPALGIPLPGPDGKGIATLTDAAENDAVLRQLDLDEKRAYPWKAADLATVVPMIVASPLELSARAPELERADKNPRRLILSTDPSGMAAKLTGLPHLADPQLWPLPLETLARQTKYDQDTRQAAAAELLPYVWRPVFWKARLLDFKRAPAAELRAAPRAAGEDTAAVETERSARDLYMKTREEDELSAWVPQPVFAAARVAAAYWLGQIALDRGNWAVARDYFGKHVLDRNPGNPWTQNSRYNLARAYEGAARTGGPTAAADRESAITWFEGRSAGPPSPQELGNHWRAKQLKKILAPGQ